MTTTVNMDQVKRSRDDTIDLNKRTRLERPTITLFEDLSNEIMYTIFESFDFYDVYMAFSNLNQRFENLLINSTLQMDIDISSISKSKFQYYYEQMIIPYQQRIHSIRITNLFIYNREFLSFQIDTILSRLEKLTIHNIQSEYLEKCLLYLRILPKLSSLNIESIDEISNTTNIYCILFRLRVLKHCQLSFNLKGNAHTFVSLIEVYSSIEHLVIKNSIRFDQLKRILLCVPKLRYLTCLNVFQINNQQINPEPIILNRLTHLSLKMRHTTFEQFKRWIKNLKHRIEVLCISTKYDFAYLDSYQWEELIINYLPRLRIFDIQHTYAVHKDNVNRICDKQFTSAFWLKRKWFFEHSHGWKNNWDNRVFHSINPYRRKYYTIYGETNSSGEKIHLNTVHHVYIQSLPGVTNCRYYFPSATKLTFENVCHLWDDSSIDSLDCILSLKQLTKLAIDFRCFSFEQVLKLLSEMPNIRIMKFHSITNDLSFQEMDNFRLVSESNIITNVTIEEKCMFEEIKLLVALCPQVEHLTIRISRNLFVQILRFLLSKTNENTRHLFSLCIVDLPEKLFESHKYLFESDGLVDDYSFRFIDNKLYLWW